MVISCHVLPCRQVPPKWNGISSNWLTNHFPQFFLHRQCIFAQTLSYHRLPLSRNHVPLNAFVICFTNLFCRQKEHHRRPTFFVGEVETCRYWSTDVGWSLSTKRFRDPCPSSSLITAKFFWGSFGSFWRPEFVELIIFTIWLAQYKQMLEMSPCKVSWGFAKRLGDQSNAMYPLKLRSDLEFLWIGRETRIKKPMLWHFTPATVGV